MTPEGKSRLIIDKKLEESGYILQDMATFNSRAGQGVAVREFSTNSGPVDYLLFIDGKPVGVVEAKATQKGQGLTSVAEQSKRYAESGLKASPIPVKIRFAYEATDIITHFADFGDEKTRTREVFSFHRPETLSKWLNDSSTLRNRLKTFQSMDETGFRACQITAIKKIEDSFSRNHPRALIQMATGAGKTYTAITSVYRLLKTAKAKRILFLVDTKNLGEQAESEFRNYKPNDDARLFPELYQTLLLKNSFIPQGTQVCISTIQRMYSVLRGEELNETEEEVSLNEVKQDEKSKEITYNSKYPPEFFDFIIIDECHRSIYNVWQQVLDYFDAFLIGLTATPDARTFGFFNQNVVSEYTHEQAVIDGVNVGRTGTFLIETEITAQGGSILKQNVERRDRLSRKKRWEQMDEDVNYTPSHLDREIVNPSQIRTVIRAFRKALFTQIFLDRKEVPKTLIYAKTDSHADDIIKIVREEFGEGNEFCKKITYGAAEDPKTVLSAFRNDFYPRIAVTVDMIATGTDIKPLECLFFMRDVHSKNYYEQMLGRATRTQSKDGLQDVSPSAPTRKLGYILIDAVGVSKSHKTASRQLERHPGIPLKTLLLSVAMGARDVDTLTTLAGRLLGLDKVLTEKEQGKYVELSGESLKETASNLLNVFDEDEIDRIIEAKCGDPTSPELRTSTAAELAEKAVNPIYLPEVRDFLLSIRKHDDQIIDNVNLDKVNFADWDNSKTEEEEELLTTFKDFLEANKDKLDALTIIYQESYRNRPFTFKMIEELHEELLKHRLDSGALWQAYAHRQPEDTSKRVEDKLMDIISLIRFELGQSTKLVPFTSEVRVKYKNWIFAKNAGSVQFTEEQTTWLRMIRDHIATSASIRTGDFDYSPFDSYGGLGKFYQLFGADYEKLLEELNVVLIA